jgi:hypothetical protein
MKKRISLVFITLLMMLLLIVPVSVSAVTEESELIVYYDFDGDFVDELSGSTLTTIDVIESGNATYGNSTSSFGSDTGSDSTFWQWTSTADRGGGFCIDVNEASLLGNYSIGVRFVYDEMPSSWAKIIDYKNRVSDDGFYFYGGQLLFYPTLSGGEGEEGYAYDEESPVFSASTIIDIVATRNAATGRFIVYTVQNGTLTEVYNYDDSSNQYATPVTVDGKVRFGFFHDDSATSSEATNGGRVYAIKMWNGPITALQAAAAMDPPTPLTLESSDADGRIAQGSGITLTPNISGGEWAYDETMFSRDGNTFTGLKAGTSRITYTAGLQSKYFDVTVALQEAAPDTGRDLTPWLLLLMLAGGVVVATILRWRGASNQA